jgi:hypothetical protein
MKEFRPKSTGKDTISIENDGNREAMQLEYMIHKELINADSCVWVGDWYEVSIP